MVCLVCTAPEREAEERDDEEPPCDRWAPYAPVEDPEPRERPEEYDPEPYAVWPELDLNVAALPHPVPAAAFDAVPEEPYAWEPKADP